MGVMGNFAEIAKTHASAIFLCSSYTHIYTLCSYLYYEVAPIGDVNVVHIHCFLMHLQAPMQSLFFLHLPQIGAQQR